MGGFRSFVPVVFPGLLGLFERVCGFFSYGVLPAYLVWTERYSVDVVREWLDECGVEWVLSSVMPDELLRLKERHDFRSFDEVIKYLILKEKGLVLPEGDIIITSISLYYDAPIVTYDVKHFKGLEDTGVNVIKP